MSNKDLKKLSRENLLELLLAQTRETELLRKKLEAAEKELQERRLQIKEVGSLAEAMVEVNGVMEAAQAAADQYLENIAALEAETQKKCEYMLQEATKKAIRIITEAKR